MSHLRSMPHLHLSRKYLILGTAAALVVVGTLVSLSRTPLEEQAHPPPLRGGLVAPPLPRAAAHPPRPPLDLPEAPETLSMTKRCARCKAGGTGDGGVLLVDGVCQAFCSFGGFCGKGQIYTQGTDCRTHAQAAAAMRLQNGLQIAAAAVPQPLHEPVPPSVALTAPQLSGQAVRPLQQLPKQQRPGSPTACRHSIPGFVIPGVEKGGTTALFNFMIRHPHVLAKHGVEREGHQSEVLFLGERWDSEGPAETMSQRKLRYQRVFQRPPPNHFNVFKPGAGCSVDDPLYLSVDKTPSYLALPDGAQKLHAIAPDAKIIISLRDPVVRAISAYRYFEHFESSLSVHLADEMSLMREFQVGPTNADMTEFNSFNDALLTRFKPHRRYHRGAIIGFGLYIVMLRQWMLVFPKDRFQVIFLEEWSGSGQQTVLAVNHLFEWLGLEKMQRGALGNTEEQINSTPKRAAKSVTTQNERDLMDLYRPFNRALEELLGRKVPDSWNHPTNH